jgi:hypothetical protein
MYLFTAPSASIENAILELKIRMMKYSYFFRGNILQILRSEF